MFVIEHVKINILYEKTLRLVIIYVFTFQRLLYE